jgi:hypothetical protein
MTHKMLTTALALAFTFAATAGAQSTDRDQSRRASARRTAGQRWPPRPPWTPRTGGHAASRHHALGRAANRSSPSSGAASARSSTRSARTVRTANGQTGAARPRRERGDTTGIAARRAEMQKRFEQRIAEVRNILTADQRTQFDKNVAEMKERRTR